MGANDHIGDRKRVYVDELETLLDEIEHWEYEYESDDVEGNRDPIAKRYDMEKINEYRSRFEELKAKYLAEGKEIYKK